MEEHVVQFYDSDDFLIDAVARFITPGLIAGHPAFIIATRPHQAQLAKSLEYIGIGARPFMPGQCAVLDADAALEAIMIDDWPDDRRFMEVVGVPLHQCAGACPSGLSAFGEMGAILWQQGKMDAAVHLEYLWNQLVHTYSLSVLCAYPVSAFSEAAMRRQPDCLCEVRSAACIQRVFAAASQRGPILDHIARLQQLARSLESETGRRMLVEQELRARLADLAEKDRRKDEFMAMLGHELRNPLAPIAISLKLLRLQQGDDAGATQWLDIIERQTLLMKRLVDDLLDVARIQLGKMALCKQVVRLTTIIDSAVELAKPWFDTLQQQLHLETPAEPIFLYGDPDRLAQALANLLHNAAKYTGTAGRIHLHAYQDQQELVLSVADNGSGLSSDAQLKIFELFQQDAASLAQARGGLGVGLALVRQIVELHGGSANAYSEGPGCGSEFVLRLPLGLVSD